MSERSLTAILEADLIESFRITRFARVLVGPSLIVDVAVNSDAPPGVIEETARHWERVSIESRDRQKIERADGIARGRR